MFRHKEEGLEGDASLRAAKAVDSVILQGGDQARVVVIEDDEVVRRLLRIALKMAGYEVSEACDGPAGIKLCISERTDLVITDISMPLMDGLEVITFLRRSMPQTRIIATSGGLIHGGVDLLSEAARLGADMTFSKPFDLRRVVKMVGVLLEKGSVGRQVAEPPPPGADHPRSA